MKQDRELIAIACTPPPAKQEILVAKAKMFDDLAPLVDSLLLACEHDAAISIGMNCNKIRAMLNRNRR
jgi:putative AlgH/UPF0301 family transcriptional regulator